ncbi:hypothetical protein B0H11DRAFT_1713106, partial [Mycena galericulata]
GPSVCAICLGIRDVVSKCRSKVLWNGSPARCHRDERGRLTSNRDGSSLCSQFQRPAGCPGRAGPNHFHECSGCGSPNHGASNCPSRARS